MRGDESMTGFDDYQETRRPRGGSCQVCRAPTKGRVQLSLQAKAPGRYPTVESTSGTFCEKHAVEIYEAAKKKVKPE